MPIYEHVFLARQDVSTTQVETMMKDYQKVIEELGGKVAKTEYWGLKTLAYKVKKNRKAHYAFFHLDSPPAAVAEMERQMRISADVLRYLTIRVEELEQGESAMMRKGDRDDRGERGGPGGGRDRPGGGGGFRGPRGPGGGGPGGGGGGFRGGDDRGPPRGPRADGDAGGGFRSRRTETTDGEDNNS